MRVEEILKSGLNNLYADRVCSVDKHTILAYAGGDATFAKSLLDKWADRKYLRILKDIETADRKGICIEIVNWIDDPRSQQNPD